MKTETIYRKCIECGDVKYIEVESEKLKRLDTEKVQDVFPELSCEVREFFFVDGICPKCWDEMFGYDEYGD